MRGKSRKPIAEDIAISKRLREMRVSADLSQGEVAEALEVAPQQYGKYERGENRISAGQFERFCRLISRKLGIEAPSFGFAERPQAGYDPGLPGDERQTLLALLERSRTALGEMEDALRGRSPRGRKGAGSGR